MGVEALNDDQSETWISTLGRARRRIDLLLPDNDASGWEQSERVDALINALRRHPMARLRILTDNSRALRTRLPVLSAKLQRLSSRVAVADLQSPDLADQQSSALLQVAVLIVDASSFSERDAHRARSRKAAWSARVQIFEALWSIASPTREWSRLTL
ncbi:MAG: hypothetical protein ACK4IT_01620 [Thioalkalivibrionaceae bacterium]